MLDEINKNISSFLASKEVESVKTQLKTCFANAKANLQDRDVQVAMATGLAAAVAGIALTFLGSTGLLARALLQLVNYAGALTGAGLTLGGLGLTGYNLLNTPGSPKFVPFFVGNKDQEVSESGLENDSIEPSMQLVQEEISQEQPQAAPQQGSWTKTVLKTTTAASLAAMATVGYIYRDQLPTSREEADVLLQQSLHLANQFGAAVYASLKSIDLSQFSLPNIDLSAYKISLPFSIN